MTIFINIMKNYLKPTLLITLSTLSVESFGAQTDSTSTLILPTSTTSQMLCPKIVGSATQLNSTPAYVSLNSADCVDMGSVPGTLVVGGALAVVAIGGVLNPSCPADYPYLAGYNQGWGVAAGIGAAGMNYRCCKPPQMSATSEWGNYMTSTVLANQCP